MNLLYVENHAPFAEIAVKTFLTDHAVRVVPSLAEARTALQSEAFDVVLVDYDLDDGKGDALVRELKAEASTPFIIAVSSHAAGNNALERAGADAVCSKLRFGEIANTLARVQPNHENETRVL